MAFEDLLQDEVIQKYLHELVGDRGMPVAASPPEGEVTDEELAQKLDLELNNVRRALFILYENELASYRRVRDEDSGWLTYLWTFNYDHIQINLLEAMSSLSQYLSKRHDFELQNEFYLCECASGRLRHCTYTIVRPLPAALRCHRCAIRSDANEFHRQPQFHHGSLRRMARIRD